MANGASQVIILAEDQEHQNLVWHYLKRCTVYRDRMGRVRKAALPGKKGCGSQYVREQFPREVQACRSRHANTLLIAITDADNLSVDEREQTLHNALAQSTYPAIQESDPVVILIPKWQVETWVKCLLGHTIREDDKTSDQPPVSAREITEAAGILHDWSRPNAPAGATCVDSLRAALPRWGRIC